MIHLRSALLGLGGFAATALAIMAGGGGDPVQAQALARHNSDALVDVAADRIEVQDRSDRVVIAGNVRVTQVGLVMNAQRITVAYTRGDSTDINRMDATGGVTVTKGDETARGDAAIYDLERRLITMVGNVELVQGANRLQGGRLLIDLDSGRATVDGRGAARGPDGTAVAGESGGRVTGRFTVPKRDQPATPRP